MFAVQPLLTAAAESRFLRDLQTGVDQRRVHRVLPFGLQFARVDGDALRTQLNFQLIGLEQLAGKAPQIIDCALHSLRRKRRAVAQALQPATAKALVVAHFF